MSLIAELATRRDALLTTLATLVNYESPSTEKAAVDTLSAWLQAQCRALGAEVTIHPQQHYGDLTVARWYGADQSPSPLLVLTHIDTVWPLGTIRERPFRIEGERAFGPGIFDMKASVAMMLEAIRWLRANNRLQRSIVWLITTEEEVGSPVSRPLIEAFAREAAYVLCLEPPTPPRGALKTARKGVGMFSLHVRGRAAHAGADPDRGVSAIVELAHQILAIQRLADPTQGTTINVGVIGGGTRPNVVAAEAWAQIDVRVTTLAEAERITQALMTLRPVLEGTELNVTGGINRPPMERTPVIAAAFARAQEIGRELGITLEESATGGGSDGNFTAALGVPTLDGLGCPGNGAHAVDEHISIPGLLERTALLIALLERL